MVHVDDILAVGTTDATRHLLQELAKEMEMRWEYGDREKSGVLGTIFEQNDRWVSSALLRIMWNSCGQTLALVSSRVRVI